MHDVVANTARTSLAPLPPVFLEKQAQARTKVVSEPAWERLVEDALFMSETVAQVVTELDARCREQERTTGQPHPTLECDEFGVNHLRFRLSGPLRDVERSGLGLFLRAAARDDRVEAVRCVASGRGFAQFRVSYRPAAR